MSNEQKFLEEAIYKNRDLKEMADEIANADGERTVFRAIDDAVNSATAIDRAVNHRMSVEDLLINCLAAHLGIICVDNLRIRVSRGVEDAIREIDDMLSEASRTKGRGGFGHRDDRSRDRGRDDRRGGFGGKRRTRDDRRDEDDRNDRRRRTRSGGFGKGADRNNDQREENSGVVEYKGKQTIVYDTSRFKLKEGVIVESYEDHELGPLAGNFNPVEVERTRKLFIDDSKGTEFTRAPELYPSYNDFVNLTSDGPLEVGVVNRVVNYAATSMLSDIFLQSMDSNPIKTVMSILSKLENVTEPGAMRLRRRLNKLALDALFIVFNMYSKQGADMGNCAVKEWEEIQALLEGNAEVFDPVVSHEVREVFKGILGHYCNLELTNDNKVIQLTSTHFGVKVAGDFITRSSVCGSDRLAIITHDYNTELNTAATAALEVRDAYFGDAWGDNGLMPIALCDSTGAPVFVVGTKASSVKYLVHRITPTAISC